MLQGPFKLTVTAAINPSFMESQLGGNKRRRGGVGTLRFGSLVFSSVTDPRHDLTEEGKPGGEDIK